MFEAEVMRLRRLRSTALRARALAENLNPDSNRGNAVFAQSAASCWRIARTITGRLRSHPHPRFQRGPGKLSSAYEQIRAAWLAAVARYQGRSLQCCSAHLGLVVRQLNDVRAVTWSADLGDSLGRFQTQLERLIQEAEAAAHWESGSEPNSPARSEPGTAAAKNCTAAGNWPYLAI
jgi:hypothetical protein